MLQLISVLESLNYEVFYTFQTWSVIVIHKDNQFYKCMVRQAYKNKSGRPVINRLGNPKLINPLKDYLLVFETTEPFTVWHIPLTQVPLDKTFRITSELDEHVLSENLDISSIQEQVLQKLNEAEETSDPLEIL